jgi:deoxyribonuclease IV
MKVGAHIHGHGALSGRFDAAQEMGAEAIQIFGAPPKVWKRRIIRPDECQAFRERMAETNIQPVFIHGPYLINLATENPDMLQKSKAALCSDVKLASAAGIQGVIFHVGSHKGSGFEQALRQVTESIVDCLGETPEDAWIILENSAGSGGTVGSKFTELGAIMKAVGSDRVKVCLDTQHAYAAGYDLAEKNGIDAAMSEFDREVGLEKLVAVHANDSKIPLGGGVDRHDNIGDGQIGKKGFETIMGHSAFAEVPFILEVPGIDKQGPDKPNVDALKAIRKKVSAT